MRGPLLAEDGARFTAIIQHTEKGPQASFQIVLDIVTETLVENDIQLFANEADAREWIDSHAAQRGFATYKIEHR